MSDWRSSYGSFRRNLIVNYDRFKIVVCFKNDEEVARARSGMLLLQSKFNLCQGGKPWWDGLTKHERARIEADSDWLNDKITEAKLNDSR